MTTIFYLLVQACGLSTRESAGFLNASENTVSSWSRGRRNAPPGVLDEMVALADGIDAAADKIIETIIDKSESLGFAPKVVEIGLASDDHEAQALGWPCVGAHRAVLALAVARGMELGYKFEIVPRGSTVGTAAAADASDVYLKLLKQPKK